jgi:mannose-6-phosphate isomerase-like protein (cupin superfamily)
VPVGSRRSWRTPTPSGQGPWQHDVSSSTPEQERLREHRDGERFLWVIGGTGTAIVGDEQLPLAPESVLWLESGDRYRVEAGPDGIELLLAEAPGR